MSVYATAENYHMTERMQAIFQRTVWALTQQVRAGHFVPTSFEISFMGLDRLDSLRISLHHEQQMHLLGRIDRLDTCEEENRIYVKVIDYKSGNTKFDLIRIYQGLALQLVVYMEAGMELTKWQNPKKEVLPGGILYYHIDDPVLEAESDKTITQQEADEKILMELRPDGLVNRDETIYRSMDEDFEGKSKVIPVELKKSGELSEARSHVASSEEFEVIGTYVRNQIKEQGERIYEGDIAVRPYRDGQESSCRFCPYAFVCGIDGKIPGYQYRTLDTFSRAEVIERMQMENAKKE
jgi:ATP-dependent helicase/nuclease subunit B